MDFQTHTHTFTHSFAHNLAKKTTTNLCEWYRTGVKTYKLILRLYTNAIDTHTHTLTINKLLRRTSSQYPNTNHCITNIQSHIHTQIHKHTHSHIHTHKVTHTHRVIHKQSHTHTESHIQSHTHTESHTHKKSHTPLDMKRDFVEGTRHPAEAKYQLLALAHNWNREI